VRCRGVSKATVVNRTKDGAGDAVIVAIGDDWTDEELFRALSSSAITVAVGRSSTSAAYRLDDYRSVRRMLRSLLTESCHDQPPPRVGYLDAAAWA